MRHLVKEAGLSHQISCDSAGTSSYHIGSSPDRRMALAAKKYGITLTGKARQFEVEDLDEFDLILAMDRDNYEAILGLDRQHQYGHKIHMMCHFCQHHDDIEVPDPYYGGPAGFDYVIELLQDACQGLLDELRPQLDEAITSAL